jgi:hypothetical protein
MANKQFDIREYLKENKLTLKSNSPKTTQNFKAYSDIRKTNLNEVKIVDGKFDLKENMKENRVLAPELKRHFLEIISTYNSFNEQMKRQSDIIEVAETLGGVIEAAKELTLREADDWFDKVTIKRNMSELEKLDKAFDKVAQEAKSLDERMGALYEDMGNILSRYYEISDIDPNTMRERLGIK